MKLQRWNGRRLLHGSMPQSEIKSKGTVKADDIVCENGTGGRSDV